MFGKLVKHELYASGRTMLPLGVILLLLAVSTNISGRIIDSRYTQGFLYLMCVLVVIAFLLGCFAIGVVAVVLLIKRFRDSMLTDQGYLTNTLPVSVHALVLSRLLAAVIYFLFVGLVIIASMIAAGAGTELYITVADGFKDILTDGYIQQVWKEYGFTGMAVNAAVYAFLSMISACLMIYLAMSIGYSFANHKGILSFVMYFVISGIASAVSSGFSGSFLDAVYSETADIYTLLARQLVTMNIMQLVLCGVYYIGTVYMLKRHLNLP